MLLMSGDCLCSLSLLVVYESGEGGGGSGTFKLLLCSQGPKFGPIPNGI